jgi:hypothetical protein
MRAVTITTIVVFSAMSLASFLAMDMPAGNGGMVGCLATKIHNGECPPQNSAFALALFHTSAFQIFSLAVLVSMVAFFALCVAQFFAAALLPALPPFRVMRAFAFARNISSSSQKCLRALARFELSPSAI